MTDARVLAAALLLCLAAPARAADDEVVATLDGLPITRGQVGAEAAFRIYRLEVDIYSLLERETRSWVDRELLEREARRRGRSPEALLAAAEAKAPPVGEEEVERYLAEHPSDDPAASRPRVRHYLEQTRRLERREAYLEGLRGAADFRWLLAPPVQPRVAVAPGAAPLRGPAEAPVLLVHFASFGSRASAQSAARLARLRAELPGATRQAHRHMLAEGDERALLAARVACLASDAARFWALHDALMERGGRVGESELAAAARAAGLGDGAPERARSDPATLDCVKRDLDAAVASGAPREPTLFVNGRYLSGLLPYEELLALVRQEMDGGVTPES